MRLRVTVPASAGNAGPGFDSFGLAYALYNEVVVDTEKPGTFQAEGEGVDQLEQGASNLVSLAMKVFSRETDRALPEHGLHLINRIPFGRGLGSSAAAIVGGMAAADALTGAELSRDEMLRLALKVENHPDNVSAAIHGGAVLTVFHDSVRGAFTCLQLPVPADWRAVLFVPDQVSPTDEARALLPTEVPRRHAIFNHSRVGLLVAAFLKGEPGHLSLAMQDRLHQPYRAKLFPAMGRLMKSAVEAGAWGSCLSGAGPAILAITARDSTGAVSSGMSEAARALGVNGRSLVLEFPGSGFQVEEQAG
jgi:homoserine kinase